MNESTPVDATEQATASGPYTIYSAGGLFTQDELAMNVMIKEAVWRLSEGRYEVFVPQSRELGELDRPDVEAYIRNTDLLEVMKADIILARFDGLELDSGTVVEFMLAKLLGKPAVILRCDFRRVHFVGANAPYNSMVKNWPRTVDVHLDSFALWARLLTEERHVLNGNDPFQIMMTAELGTIQKSVDEIACEIIAGLDAVLKMDSPHPPEYQELVYEASRFSVGSGFDQVLTASELRDIIQRLRKNGTL